MLSFVNWNGVPKVITFFSASGPLAMMSSSISNSGHAAIDGQIHSGDEACFVRSEEQSCRRDLLRAAEPPERDGRGELGADLVGPVFGRRLLLEDRRVDWARTDRIDPNATILQLRRPRADEGADCCLGG